MCLITTTVVENGATMSTRKAAPPPPPPSKQRVHEDPLWKQLLHFDEVFAALYLLGTKPIKCNLQEEDLKNEDLNFCNRILGSVARPYAAAIRQLPKSTLVNVMILHHALRALDTIEDDMTAFATNDIKIEYLKTFVATALSDEQPNWSLDGVGQGDEAVLLQEFPKVHRVFQTLPKEAQAIIQDITHRMALGMSEFIQLRNFQGPQDLKEYNRYCHWVAGLVAEGLIRLFALDGLETPSFAKELELADHVGFFLQKVNILRDFLEDYHDHRIFWPHSVIQKYVPSVSHLADPRTSIEPKVQCLNDLVTNALQEIPPILTFLNQMQGMETHRFFALLLLGALATLKECYNNPNVFTGKVRMRKGLACKLALAGHDKEAVRDFFGLFAEQIQQTALMVCQVQEDPNWEQTNQICEKILTIVQPDRKRRQAARQWQGLCYVLFMTAMLVVGSVLGFFLEETQSGAPMLLLPWTVQKSVLAATLVTGLYITALGLPP